MYLQINNIHSFDAPCLQVPASTPMDLIDCDILIVGGGPAGCMTALLLADSGLRITIIEAKPKPIEKPCGEFLSPDGLRILKRVGVLDAVMNSGAMPLYGLDLVSNQHRLSSDYELFLGYKPDFKYGLGIRRERFESVLLQACRQKGVQVLEGCRCVSIENIPEHHKWYTNAASDKDYIIRSTLIVGSDGRNSRIRHWAGLNKKTCRQRFALMCRAHSIAYGRHGEMHIGPLGQIGLAPIGEGEVNLNVLLSPYGKKMLKVFGPRMCMQLALKHTPSLSKRCEHVEIHTVHTTGSLPQASTSVIGNNIALIGDAAGFCDPFTGEGMCIALQSAEILADSLKDWDGNDAQVGACLQHYARTYNRHFGWRQRTVRRLQRILDHRVICHLLIKALSQSHYAMRGIVALTGDYIFRGAKR